MTRGFTLLETTLSLTLLAALASVSVSWSMGFARLAADTGDSLNRVRALSELRRSLQDDLSIHDFAASTGEQSDRVVAQKQIIRIRTRLSGLGSITVAYRYEQRSGKLLREAGSLVEPVLGGLERVHFSLENDVLLLELVDSLGEYVFALDLDGRPIGGGP